jgi:S-adenosyl-L-methionine hydrolase (adenosine-forming)
MKLLIATLISDFGLSDAYVAEMKATILRHAPAARLIDVTHDIPAQDVLAGSIALQRALAAFGAGTLHLAVVDPGVGTRRKLLVVKINRQTVICPDNGLITWAWRLFPGAKAFELTWRPKRFSNTFHGRDIMAPVVGMLAAGKSLRPLVSRQIKPILLDILPAGPSAKWGQIIHIDRFGNAMTNLPAAHFTSKNRAIRIRGKSIGVYKTYGEVKAGAALALIGSGGFLEIAVRDASAAKRFSLRVGDRVLTAKMAHKSAN